MRFARRIWMQERHSATVPPPVEIETAYRRDFVVRRLAFEQKCCNVECGLDAFAVAWRELVALVEERVDGRDLLLHSCRLASLLIDLFEPTEADFEFLVGREPGG